MKQFFTILCLLKALSSFAITLPFDTLHIDTIMITINQFPLDQDRQISQRVKDIEDVMRAMSDDNDELCWQRTSLRRYWCHWKIQNDSLFLSSVHTACSNDSSEENPYRIDRLFYNQYHGKPIFIDWFSGTLSKHCFSQYCKRNVHFTIKNGLIIPNPPPRPTDTKEKEQFNQSFLHDSELNSRFYICLLVACLFALLRLLYKKFP